jgi:hypothetical protein
MLQLYRDVLNNLDRCVGRFRVRKPQRYELRGHVTAHGRQGFMFAGSEPFMLLDPLAKQVRMQIVRSRHGGNRYATLLAAGDHLGLVLVAELTPMAPTFLCGKLVGMHYSTCWDELLHQESRGTAILYDLPRALKMVLPDAYAAISLIA